ncbi:hypothetical protein [Micromonospora sp. LOL_023]|uniref:hypothetical protein n=1 Tax=Micromonospora sp. LOL_023 TaxID=3345418 RepID=UPI003A86E8DD
MTGRIVWTEVRRSAVPGLAVLFLVVCVGLTLTSIEFFAGRWTQLMMYGRGSLVLLFPLALAGGAWLGRRDRRHRVGELFATTVRPRWQRIFPLAVGYAGAMVTVYLLVLLIGAVWVIPTAGYFPSAVLGITAVGALAVVAAGWLGMAAGRAVPRIVTAPVLAVVAFAVVALLPDFVSMAGYDENFVKTQPDPSALLLNPASADSLDDFQTIAGSVSLVQAVWLGALAGSALLLISAVRRSVLALAVLPAVLGAAVAVPLLPAGGYPGAAVVDPVAVELVCDDNGPQVCVRRVHAALLPDLVEPVREALAVMAAKLPDPPVRAVQSTRMVEWAAPEQTVDRHDADTLTFETPSIDRSGRADLSSGYFEAELLRAPWSQECGNSTLPSTAQEVAAAWLLGEPPVPPDWLSPEQQQLVEASYQALTAMPADQQRQVVAQARDAALDCDTDRLGALLLVGDV